MDSHIAVVNQFPLFKNVPRDPSLGTEAWKLIRDSDRDASLNDIHLQV